MSIHIWEVHRSDAGVPGLVEDSHHTGLVVGRIEVDRSCPLVRTVFMTATWQRNLPGKQRWEEGTAHTFAVGTEVDHLVGHCSILG